MSAGYKYYMEPEPSIEERYDVSTGVRRRGPYKLDTTNLVAGSFLPSFTPIAADLVKKTAQVAIRVEVYEKFTTGSNTTLKIKKNSLAYVGMHLGNGSHGATINSIDKSDKAFDKLTLAADFGETVEVGTVLYEATAVSGTTPKVVANSALYGRVQVEEGVVLVALLMRAFEIEPTKLAMPFSDIDKANMPHFQFNAAGVQSPAGVSYELPEASDSVMGGIQLGFSQSGKKYPVALEGGKAYVEVPWTDNNTTYQAANSSTLGLVKQGAKVDDAAGGDEKDKINALLASLRAAGIIAGQRNNLRGKSDKFISLPERKSAKVMETSGYRLLLPEGTLDYFIISDVKESSTEIVIYLEEKNEVPGEYSSMQVENKGFYEPVVVQDFPIRGKKLFLNIRRRRWIVKDEGRYVSRNWKLVAEGSRMTHDFASFLKELY